MTLYIVKRLFGLIPTLFFILTLSFAMMKMAPGGPFDFERQLPVEIEEALNKVYNLDKPLHQQYILYLKDMVKGDLGPSFQYQDFTVNELIYQGFPVSFTIGFSAMILAIFIGLITGSLAALHHQTWRDYTLMGLVLTASILPTFVIAPLLTLVFGVYLRWLPISGWNYGALDHLILPIVALSLPYTRYIARLTRGSMIDVLNSPFIRTAYAKGLPTHYILYRHALKPALLPVLSFIGPASASILTGSVVIEQIFSLPGIGRFFVSGAMGRDYPLVMGIILFYAVLLVIFNLIVDILYVYLDPKVRYD